MSAFLRTIHTLSVALWFGTVAFFTIAGLLIFQAFETVSRTEHRPSWFPVPQAYQKETPPDSKLPSPLRLEQGSRAAGVAVSKIFPVYFALQTGCAVVAVLTAFGLAFGWPARLNTLRVGVCVLGLICVLAGWWLEIVVSDLRVPRNELTDQVLEAAAPSEELITQMKAARAKFGMWHGISLLVNFATLGLTLVAVGIAAHGPSGGTGPRTQ